MKKFFILACTVTCLVFAAGTAMAESIKGRIGVTGRVGFLVPSDSEAFFPTRNLDTEVGFIGGGGFIYGFGNNLAAEIDVTHTEFDINDGPSNAGNLETTNISLGVQYRFVDLPLSKLVPYVGAGVDILLNDGSNASGASLDVDTVAGVHISGGVDYFILKQLALTAEVKAVLAPEANINFNGQWVGNYDTTSLSTTFGVRYFFN